MAEVVFLSIYSAEALLKILSRGLVASSFTYLRNGWNLLELIVVILGWVGLALGWERLTAPVLLRLFSLFDLRVISNAILYSLR